MDKTYFTYLDSPIGRLLLAGNGESLKFIGLANRGRPQIPPALWERAGNRLREPVRQLAAYFEGKRTDFDLALAPEGTPFQRRVWQELLRIPYGATVSYGQIARGIGKPKAARAVGAACGSNPLPIVIPCHRVLGSSGAMTGYGGGLPAKKILLALEDRNVRQGRTARLRSTS